MKIKLATINLEVADPQRAKRFYLDALGLTENLERSHPPGFVYLESEGGDVTLATPQEAAAAEPSRTMELGFEVDDLDALRARLAEHGVTGFRPQSMGWGEVLKGHDPDGHRVIVYSFAQRPRNPK
jgi:catechol 2,3-dioxygenase-like lactoylglutathione lyase family enzyme